MTDQPAGKVTVPLDGPNAGPDNGLASMPEGAGPQQWAAILMARLLVSQCTVGQAGAGAVLQIGPDRSVSIVAAYPSPDSEPRLTQWLTSCQQAASQVLSDTARQSGPWQVVMQPQNESQTQTILVSMDLPQLGRFVEAFAMPITRMAELGAVQHRLVQSVRMIEAYDQQMALHGPIRRLQAVGVVLGIAMAVGKHARFLAAAMEFCNQLASGWGCDRVSLGVLVGRMVQLKAISHTERFSRKTRPMQLIEAAMEEAIDQDTTIIWPVPEGADYVARAVGKLANQDKAGAILAMPLQHEHGPVGAVLLERAQAFDQQSVEAIRLTCQLCAPPILRLWVHNRWFGAKLAGNIKSAAATLVGPRYTWAKVAACAMAIFLAWVVFAKGVYRVHAPFVVSAEVLHDICAPFDGYLKQVNVEVGQTVDAGKTVLAELDTAELRLQLASARAELASYLKQADAYMRDRQIAKAQIAQADADKVQAQIELIEYMISRASLTSPISGTVVKGDLKKQIGSPVKTGQVLFEVTPLESLYAELLVPEDQVLDIAVGQSGALATASFPTDRIGLVVERVEPKAEVVSGRNVFKVRARLEQTRQWLRPGMEGVAKVVVDRRPYIWIWTRKLINWIRMKVWI